MHGIRFNCTHCCEELIITPPDGPGDEIKCPGCERRCRVPQRNSRRALSLGLSTIVAAVPFVLGTIAKLMAQPTVIMDWCRDFLACEIFDVLLKLYDPAHSRCFTTIELQSFYEASHLQLRSIETFRLDYFSGLNTCNGPSA